MSRLNGGASVYLKHFLVFIFLSVFFLLFDVSVCWKLRDISTQRNDKLNVTIESRRIKNTYSAAPPLSSVKLDIKKIPLNFVRKQKEVEVDDDDDNDIDDKDTNSGAGTDIDDVENVREEESEKEEKQEEEEEEEEEKENEEEEKQEEEEEEEERQEQEEEEEEEKEEEEEEEEKQEQEEEEEEEEEEKEEKKEEENENDNSEDKEDIVIEEKNDKRKKDDKVVTKIHKANTTETDDAEETKFVFERVRQANYDFAKIKKPIFDRVSEKIPVQENKDEKEEEEEEKSNAKQPTKKTESTEDTSEPFYQPLLILLDEIFVRKPVVNPDGQIESKRFFEWLSFYRNEETKTERQTEEKIIPLASEENPLGWKSFFDRKPFSYFWVEPENTDLQVREREDDHGENDHIEKNRSALAPEYVEKLLLNIPSFVPNYTKIENPNCKRLGQIFFRQIRSQKLWAVQMWDSTAKIPSGLLRGNTHQFGDFDLCTEIRTKVKVKDEKPVKVKGKYCMANIDVRASDEELKLAVHLMQGRNLFRGRLEDPGHFLPRFSTLKWGICVPHGCTHDDARDVLNDLLMPYNVTGIKLFVDIDETDCTVKNTKRWPDLIADNSYIIGTLAFFGSCLFLVCLTSINDCWKELKLDVLFAPEEYKTDRDKRKSQSVIENVDVNAINSTSFQDEIAEPINENDVTESTFKQIYMAFSIKRTTKKLIESSELSDQLEFIDGIKGISSLLLFVCLKFLTIGHQPFSNRAHLTEILNTPPSILLRIILLYMNTFLTISGFLVALDFLKEFDQTHRVAWLKRSIARYLRLVFPLIAILLFTAWIFENIDNGPQWGNLIKQNADLCKEGGWKNLLFISNWFPAQQQCAPHLSEIAVHFQLFLLMPLFIWAFKKDEDISIAIFSILLGFSCAFNFSDTISQRLSPVIFHGMKLTQIYRTINLSFFSPIHRATPYVIGAAVGAIMHNAKQDIVLPVSTYLISWSTALFFMAWCIYTPMHLAYKDYIYEPTEMADYAAWAPMLWSLGLCWIIYVCFIEKAELLTRFLTLKPFVILGKISYEFYLVQLTVLFYFVATSQSNESFNIWTAINFLELTLCLLAAVLLALTIGFPFQTISQILIKTGQNKIFDGQNAITEGETVAENAESEVLVESNQAEATSVTPSRRVSWGSKIHNANDLAIRRPTTPIWKKEEAENNHNFWDDNDDSALQEDIIDRPELETDEPIEISFSDLEDQRDDISSEDDHDEFEK